MGARMTSFPRRTRLAVSAAAVLYAIGLFGAPGPTAVAAEATAAPTRPAANAHGDAAAGAITVAGSGEAKAKPTLLEIEARITGSGELVNDTLTKYRETRRRALDAIKALNIP